MDCIETLHPQIPVGTNRNWESYGQKIGLLSDFEKSMLADPQTSGGLLIAVDVNAVEEVKKILLQNGLEKFTTPIGYLTMQQDKIVSVAAL